MAAYTLADHNAAVSKIATQVRKFYDRKEPFRIYHGSTNSTRRALFDPDKIVDTSSLTHILNYEPPTEGAPATITAQSNVPMDALVRHTLKHGLIPAIVPEFPGITVGGAFAGTAGESTSWEWGFFDRGVESVEAVVADGRVVRVSRDGVKDGNGKEISADGGELWRGMAGGLGTLGVATLLEVQLVRAETHVEVEYVPVKSASAALEVFERARNEDGMRFMDGILFSADRGVVVLGRWPSASKPKLPVQTFTRRSDPWFYLHAEKVSTGTRKETHRELVPTFDYLFRYDRGAFWMASHMFGDTWLLPWNALGRWAWDGFCNTREQYRLMHARGVQNSVVVQDIVLPAASVTEFVEWNVHGSVGDSSGDSEDKTKGLDIWPLWLCPFRADSDTIMHQLPPSHADSTALSINVGIWGMGSPDYEENVAMNKRLEKKVSALGGRKWLYGQVFYTEEEFWQIYDKEKIGKLRETWSAGRLPSVWDKVRNKETGATMVSEWQMIKNYRAGRGLLKK